MVKLIATDMDGTFLRPDHTYNQAQFDALYQKMRAQGIRFVVASGNQYAHLQADFQAYPDVIFIAENGAYIRTAKQVYQAHTFAPVATAYILKQLQKQPQLKILLSCEQSAYVLATKDSAYLANRQHYYDALQQVTSFEQVTEPVLKFGITCPEDETADLVQALRDSLAGLAEPTSSGFGDIDLIQPGLHKAAALAELGAQLQIDLADMWAFGDGGNDLEMLQAAGRGIAMANATSAVKTAANAQTGSCTAQGVLQYLDAHL